MTKRKRRAFTDEYKAEVVELIRKSGKSVGAVARELALTETAVRRWVQQAEIDSGGGPAGALTTAEREELARLRKRVKTLEMEREILKKATLGSTSQRNTFVQHVCGRTEVQCLARTLVQPQSHSAQVGLRASRQIGSFREVLA